MRIGIGTLGLDPRVFWRLTPWELMLKWETYLELQAEMQKRRALCALAIMRVFGKGKITIDEQWRLMTGEALPEGMPTATERAQAEAAFPGLFPKESK